MFHSALLRRELPSLLLALVVPLSGLSLLAGCQQISGLLPGSPLTQPFSYAGIHPGFDWSPDRQTLSLAVDFHGEPRKYAGGTASSALYLIDSRSGRISQRFQELVADRSLAWSPDGKWLQYSPWQSAGSLGYLQVPSGHERYFVDQPLCSATYAGAWSADNSRIACVRQQDHAGTLDRVHVYVMDLKGKQLNGFDTGLPIKSTEPGSSLPSASNHHDITQVRWLGSDRLLFHEIISVTNEKPNQTVLGRERYYVADLTARRVEKIYERDNRHSSAAEISPDAKSLLFDDFTLLGAMPGSPLLGSLDDQPDSRIHRLELGSRESRELAAGSRPRWSPDGSRIAYLHQGDLMLMRADGSEQRRLLAKSALAGRELHSLGWTPDSRDIVAVAQVRARSLPLMTRSEIEFGILRIDAASAKMTEVKPDLGQLWRDAGMP